MKEKPNVFLAAFSADLLREAGPDRQTDNHYIIYSDVLGYAEYPVDIQYAAIH